MTRGEPDRPVRRLERAAHANMERSSGQVMRLVAVTLAAAVIVAFSALAGSTGEREETIALSPMQRLGKAVFSDPELSFNRNQSCAQCHAPAAGFSGPDSEINAGGAVYEGSILGRFGNVKPPTASYVTPAPVLYHTMEDGKPLFVGGLFFNGRATGKKLGNAAADQAQHPFLDPKEMALPDTACVVYRVCNPKDPGSYPVKPSDIWGGEFCRIDWPKNRDIDADCSKLDEPLELEKEPREKAAAAFDRIARSIAAYLASPEVSPYSSKFDFYLAGKAKLSAQEQLGMEVFMGKGLCGDCHIMEPGPNGEPPLLTDFTYDNLGGPRNGENPFYGQKAFNPEGRNWVDIGLGGPLAEDLFYKSAAAAQQGKQKVPTLRNVDKRPAPGFVKSYTHNGYFKTLKGVVNFYNTRDTKPACPDPLTSEAQALAQNCWPEAEVKQNVNKDELGNLKLTEAEEQALVAFMRTLSDGYQPEE